MCAGVHRGVRHRTDATRMCAREGRKQTQINNGDIETWGCKPISAVRKIKLARNNAWTKLNFPVSLGLHHCRTKQFDAQDNRYTSFGGVHWGPLGAGAYYYDPETPSLFVSILIKVYACPLWVYSVFPPIFFLYIILYIGHNVLCKSTFF